MRRLFAFAPLSLAFVAASLHAQQNAPTQLTIYNGGFAVARTSVPLDLHNGVNDVLTTDVTSELEPDSVVLRDPSGKRTLHILEQNYDAGVVTQQWMLQKYEGKAIDFQLPAKAGEGPQIVQGKIVRAGNDPLIEVNGRMQFQLPGTPLFPASTDGLLLKPTLRWKIETPSEERFPAELDYITNGLSWQATYNVVLPEAPVNGGAEKADIVGWVTIQNNSGTDFPATKIQLMAGDVAKIQDFKANDFVMMARGVVAAPPPPLPVSQKAFDDFHLYDLHRTLSLTNGESKQVQFLEASGVTVERSYQFESSESVARPYAGYHNVERTWGSMPDAKVFIREEIKNTEANHLGMPLPAGRLRLYRREDTGQMQFVGESQVEHTPEGRSLHLTSGTAFDLTGERKQTDFHVNSNGHDMDESFSITLHNAKPQLATIHVVEHMNRAQNWTITQKSTDYTKQDSATIDFPVQVPAKGDATLTYAVHYTW